MKHKKEVYYLEDPSPDPFLVSSDLDRQMLQKYHYSERQEYERYKKRERLHLILIGLVVCFLAGLLYLLLTVPAEKIDNFLM